jgi:hypothetical protein
MLLLKRVWSELRTILEKQQEQIESVAKQTKAQDRTDESTPSPLRVKVESLETAIEEYKSDKHSSHKLQWATFWLTLGTLVALIIAACFTAGQWRIMNKTYGEIQKQTRADGRQLEVPNDDKQNSRSNDN